MQFLSVFIQVLFLVAAHVLALPTHNAEQATLKEATNLDDLHHHHETGLNFAPSTSLVARDTDYMSVLNYWRVRVGAPALTWSAKLQANALDTVVSGNGQMIHKLNPGTFGQVLAPGNPGSFENVFVGGWLCELPGLPGLNGCCVEWSKGWLYLGQTKHAEIVTSTAYSHIGCALANGIWGCDLGNA
ncbi:hypothetical protein DM02DRAFT_563990 [Periconia macrospinosa]|uniref:SCP domain-containing protein n=1 Tax=Periconia macrospinosa TaxID=97972 RepID=A0A2V1DRN1_9PLEO|nr:hypothetical protein DM02DRAFT_563990 [Periconia macrospinosa]